MTQHLHTTQGRTLAYDRTPGREPGVVFLGGFRSDKEGSKALHLEAWARARGRAFLRFDYSGHGQSSGAFEDGCIGDWAEDARAALEALTEGPQILVGSSMGGWIATLIARDDPARVAALVGIAAAPDFTDRFLADLAAPSRDRLMAEGRLEVPSEYAPEPYVFTRRLIEDGAARRVLDRPLRLGIPVRLLQGTEDSDVPVAAQIAFFDHLHSPDARLTLVKGADHRFSSPDCLDLLTATLDALG
jgi:pimeloyl-ACP methyl ester carboxylesterase